LKYYLDEDLSPKIAEILRKSGIDAISAHEIGMLQTADVEHMDRASTEGRCLITRNRNDFIQFGRCWIKLVLKFNLFAQGVLSLSRYEVKNCACGNTECSFKSTLSTPPHLSIQSYIIAIFMGFFMGLNQEQIGRQHTLTVTCV